MSPERIECVGQLQETLPGTWRFEVTARSERGTMAQLAAGSQQPSPAPPLGVETKIIANGAVCGIAREGGAGCRMGDHGFSSGLQWINLY